MRFKIHLAFSNHNITLECAVFKIYAMKPDQKEVEFVLSIKKTSNGQDIFVKLRKLTKLKNACNMIT